MQPQTFRVVLVLLAGSAFCPVVTADSATPASGKISFSRRIAPILSRRCQGCHGAKRTRSNYAVHTFNRLIEPGDHEEPPLVPGRPDESNLYRLLLESDPKLRMPRQDDPLSRDEIALFRKWIAEGAVFDGPDPDALLSSLLPPRRHPAAPAVYRVPVPVFAVAFAPGGEQLAVGGYHEVTVWDAATGALVRRIPGLPQRTQSLAFLSERSLLLVGGGSPGEYGEVTLVDWPTGKPVRTLGTMDDIVMAVAFSPDGKWAAVGAADHTLRVYDVASGREAWRAKRHVDMVTDVAFNHDGSLVASAGRDMTVKVCHARTGALYTTYNGHMKRLGPFAGQFKVFALAFDPDHPRVVTAGEGAHLQIWDPAVIKQEDGTAADLEERFRKAGSTRRIEHGYAGDVYTLEVRGGHVYSASEDGRVKQHDLETLRQVREFRGPSRWLFALDCDETTGRVAAAGFGGTVRIWGADGTLATTFTAAPGVHPPASPVGD